MSGELKRSLEGKLPEAGQPVCIEILMDTSEVHVHTCSCTYMLYMHALHNHMYHSKIVYIHVHVLDLTYMYNVYVIYKPWPRGVYVQIYTCL